MSRLSTDKTSRAADDYLELVRVFPLRRPIRSEQQYDRAGSILNRLLGRPDGKLTSGERDYVDALARFVQDYDETHSRLAPAHRSPHEALRYVVEQAGMSVTELGRLLGVSHSAASMILRGKRGISKSTAKQLAEHFRLDVAMFL